VGRKTLTQPGSIDRGQATLHRRVQQHAASWPQLAAGPAGVMTLLREGYAASEYAGIIQWCSGAHEVSDFAPFA
jgi:hypothetical protein